MSFSTSKALPSSLPKMHFRISRLLWQKVLFKVTLFKPFLDLPRVDLDLIHSLNPAQSAALHTSLLRFLCCPHFAITRTTGFFRSRQYTSPGPLSAPPTQTSSFLASFLPWAAWNPPVLRPRLPEHPCPELPSRTRRKGELCLLAQASSLVTLPRGPSSVSLTAGKQLM